MTTLQLEIYNYCRALGFGETAALKAATALQTRADLAKVRSRIRLSVWLLGAALMLTAAAQAFT
jgi:hypothetical protein